MAKRNSKHREGVAFTPEFRQSVVDRVTGGEPQVKVARSVGISVGSIRNWLGLTGRGKTVRASKALAATRRPAKRRMDIRTMATVGVSGDPAVYVLRIELDKAEKRVASLRRAIEELSDVAAHEMTEAPRREPLVGPNGGEQPQPQA